MTDSMPPISPALSLFLAQLTDTGQFAEVHIRRVQGGFNLCHVRDQDADPTTLRKVAICDLRNLAMFTESGGFRPLKAAPNLPSNWMARCPDDRALGEALDHLYPGALTDWHAVHSNPAPPVTDYREFRVELC